MVHDNALGFWKITGTMVICILNILKININPSTFIICKWSKHNQKTKSNIKSIFIICKTTFKDYYP